MTYQILTVTDPKEVANAPILEIEHQDPSYSKHPKTIAQLVYVKNQGFACRMTTWEKNPKAVITEVDGDTYKDSCMEWFINFNPAAGNDYLNFEGNAAAVLHCKLGKDRYVRNALAAEICRPTAAVKLEEDHWSIDYYITLETIKAVFGRDTFASGDVLKGNFYKCGDETDAPHYGMWSPVMQENLDFHTPQYFGDLVITD